MPAPSPTPCPDATADDMVHVLKNVSILGACLMVLGGRSASAKKAKSH